MNPATCRAILAAPDWQSESALPPPAVRDWLLHRGSLTARLRQHGTLTVHIEQESWNDDAPPAWQRDVWLAVNNSRWLYAETRIPRDSHAARPLHRRLALHTTPAACEPALAARPGDRPLRTQNHAACPRSAAAHRRTLPCRLSLAVSSPNPLHFPPLPAIAALMNRAARCHDFIMAMPDGYQTRVGDIGGKLSGGEKQRISIARALLKNVPIIILDEPTAALDTESEVAVQHAIDALVKDKTVIVITHRLSTISGAQQIIVLADGQVAESGSHDGLLAQNGLYRKLWQAGGWDGD